MNKEQLKLAVQSGFEERVLVLKEKELSDRKNQEELEIKNKETINLAHNAASKILFDLDKKIQYAVSHNYETIGVYYLGENESGFSIGPNKEFIPNLDNGTCFKYLMFMKLLEMLKDLDLIAYVKHTSGDHGGNIEGSGNYWERYNLVIKTSEVMKVV